MVNSAESLRYFFLLYISTNTSRYLTLDVIYMRFIIKVAVHRYSQKLGMVRHTDFFIVYNEGIVDVNITPRFLNVMKWVFFKFKDNLLMFNQSIILSFRYSFLQLAFQDIFQRGTDLNHPRKEGEIKHRKLLTDHWYTTEITMDQEWILGVLRM